MTQAVRLLLLLAATSAWWWAISPYTPWAADLAPRLWLYDTLYYARVVLLAWLAAEIALVVLRSERRSVSARVVLALLVSGWIAAWLYDDSGIGWRWRVQASRPALDRVARVDHSDRRQRAGHVIVDTVRTPCGTRWLWLGRPHGAGSGINLALVRSQSVPRAPVPDAFVFLPLGGGWWMAYEHAAIHHALSSKACVPGSAVRSHRAGMAHVEARRR